jgi:hypothetical protein
VDGGDVQQNARITGKITGRSREVDVAIRTNVAGEPLLIAVECRRKIRKSDVGEIEAFASKLEDIGAHKGIAVSAKGFSAAAQRLAAAKGISLYRYEDTLKKGWPSGLETYVILEIWEINPVGAFLRKSDGSTVDIVAEDEHEYFDSSTGANVPLATIMRCCWDKVPEMDKCNGDQCYEHPLSTPDDPSFVMLGLSFQTFRHKVMRLGRLQFEGLVDDESKVAKVKGWKMIFPDAGTGSEAPEALRKALSLLIRTTIVRTEGSNADARLNLLLYGCLEINVGFKNVNDLSFT